MKRKVIAKAEHVNWIVEYWNQIESGQVVVCRKTRLVYKHLIAQMNDPTCEWEYNDRRADHPIDFIEKYCKHSKGKLGGKPLLLELWEKAAIAAAFGFVHKIDGFRQFQEMLLIVGRKNGKSTLGAAIGLYLMIADGEPGAEIYACATKKDQAKIIWLEAKRMVKKSPALLRKIKPLVAEMVSEFNDSIFKPLGADSDTQDGLNVSGATLDEIHAWKGKELYDVIVDGTTARDEPFIFIPSTAGTVRDGIYDIKYDEADLTINGYEQPGGYKNPRFLPIIYELNKRSDWTNPKCWGMANPGLGSIKKFDQLKAKVEKAQNNIILVKNLLCKDFNIRETVSEAWLTFEQLNNEAAFDIKKLKPRYGIGGVDLSITTDLTNATIIFKVPGDETIYVLGMYWLPEDLLESREKDDKVPYSIWKERGLLRTTPGNKVNYKFVVEWFEEVKRDLDIYIFKVGYDYYSADYFVKDMQLVFGTESMDAVHQGTKTLSGPMHSLGADLESKKINYNNNDILKWCLSNVSIVTDKNLGIQPCKVKNQRRRIDGFAGLLDAYVELERCHDDYMNVI